MRCSRNALGVFALTGGILLPVEPGRAETGACCLGDQCEQLEQTPCEGSGGDWLGGLEPTVADCTGDPCSVGVCCRSVGSVLQCDDDDPDNTLAGCAAVGGDYHGGLTCPAEPCAVCEFENPGHCQLDTGLYVFPSDRFVGTRRADDFIPIPPAGAEDPEVDLFIHRVCFEMVYVHVIEGQECYDNPPPEEFNVHFYETGLDGLPATELPESATMLPEEFFNVDKAAPKGPNIRTWRFSGPVGDPITGVRVTPNECYWIEITGMGTAYCKILWTHSRDGNNFGMRDGNQHWGPEDVRDSDVVFCIDVDMQRATIPGVDGGCGPVPVACCYRDWTCDDDFPTMHFSQCRSTGGLPAVGGSCQDPCPFPGNDDCYLPVDPENPDPNRPPNGAFEICTGDWGDDLGAWHEWSGGPGDRLGECMNCPGDRGTCFGQVCHPEPWEIRTCHGGSNDGHDCTLSDRDCGAPDICILDDPGGMGQDCVWPPNIDGSNICQPYRLYNMFMNAFECYATTDNRLASTDGPTAGGGCFGSGENSFRVDVWYTVTAPCYGKAIIDMCDAPAEYDSMLAVYGDHTDSPRCPQTGPDNEDLLGCNDDYCEGGNVSAISWYAALDAVYILRLGGWSDLGSDSDAGQGVSRFHIGFYCEPPLDPMAPVLPPNPVHRVPKHRYLSIDATTNATAAVALKVELASMKRCSGDLRRACKVDGDCQNVCENDHDRTCTTASQCDGDPCVETGPCVEHPDVGLSWWVQEPFQVSDGCLPGNNCGDEDWIARLDSSVHSQVWTSNTLHIGDCAVVPAATYLIYACNPLSIDYCDYPLVIATQGLPFNAPGVRGTYGDMVGPVDGESLEFAPPDGIVNINDVSGFLLTKQNYGTSAKPQAHPTWIDLSGIGTGNPPNYILGLADLQQLLFGLHGHPWTQDPGNLQPGACP